MFPVHPASVKMNANERLGRARRIGFPGCEDQHFVSQRQPADLPVMGREEYALRRRRGWVDMQELNLPTLIAPYPQMP